MASFPRLILVVVSAALAVSCAAAGRPRATPSPSAASPAASPAASVEPASLAAMAAMAAAPLDLSWEASRLLPPSDYLHFPAADGGPGFFLVRNGFRLLDADNFALRYDRTPGGFSLVEVKKRSGTSPLAQCPVFFPVENCVEHHHLLFATVVSCGASCSYRFVVFDSHSPFPITLRDPAIFGVLKRLADPWLPAPELEVKFEEAGTIRGTDGKWAEFVRDRFAFMAAKVREAEKPPGFRLLRPSRW